MSSANNSYLNLRESHTGNRKISYPDSYMNQPMNQQASLTYSPPKGNLDVPQKWFSPRSSASSDFQPSESKYLGKVRKPINDNQNRQTGNKKLPAIEEDTTLLTISKTLELCNSRNEDVQANALAYLQHITFNNNENKREVKEHHGLQIVIDASNSQNAYVAKAALGVLKNLSFSDEEAISTDIYRLGGVQHLLTIIESNQDMVLKELAIDVLWNLSAKYELKTHILAEVVDTLIYYVILPDCHLMKNEEKYYVSDGTDVVWSQMLRNALGIIRNISIEDKNDRIRLRNKDGLVDSLFHLIRASNDSNMDAYKDTSLVDSKIIENASCILRNLSYAIQETVDSGYHDKRGTPLKRGKDKASELPQPLSHENPMGIEFLWNASEVSDICYKLLKGSSNGITLEAAAGIVQNLTAGSWKPSQDARHQLRLQKVPKILIELVEIGSDEIVRSASAALRNLVLEEHCCSIVGSEGLQTLTEKLPSSSRRINMSAMTLATLLATIYAVIKGNVEFMKQFVTLKGAHKCLFIRDSDKFIDNDSDVPDRAKTFSQCTLELLWKNSASQELMKADAITHNHITLQGHHKNQSTVPENPEPANNRVPSVAMSDSSIDSFNTTSIKNYRQTQAAIPMTKGRTSISSFSTTSDKSRNQQQQYPNYHHGQMKAPSVASSTAHRTKPINTGPPRTHTPSGHSHTHNSQNHSSKAKNEFMLNPPPYSQSSVNEHGSEYNYTYSKPNNRRSNGSVTPNMQNGVKHWV